MATKLLPGTFLLNAKIDSRKASLVVDTGAATTVLSPRQAVVAQVLLTGPGPTIQHWGREIPTYLGRVRELDLAGLVAHDVPVIILGKQPILKLLGLPIWHLDGLLGMNPLKRLAVSLDYAGGTVALRREPLPIPLGALSAPLKLVEQEKNGFRHPIPMVEGFINGSGPFDFFIDTGTSGPVIVPEDVLQALGLKGQKSIRLKQLQLGAIELQDVPAIEGKQARFILIGSNIFYANSYRRLTLDFLAGKIYVER